MKQVKKTTVMLMALVLVFTLAACGGNSTNNGGNQGANQPANQVPNNGGASSEEAIEEELVPEEGAKLIVWDSGDQKAFVEEAAKAFTAEYGVPVEFTEVGADKSVERMTTDGPAKVGADVFAAVHDRTGSAVSAGLILPNDWFELETKESAYETAIEAVSVNGMLYGYPKSVETTAVFYNKDLIAEVPATWDGVIEFAKEFNDPKNNKWSYMWELGNGYWSYSFFGGYGAYVFGDNGTNPDDIGMNSPEAVEAGKFYQSLRSSVLPLQTSDITGDIKKSLFESGKLAMNVSGPWDTGSLKEKVANLGVAPYPTLPNGQPMKPFSGVKAYYVNAFTPYPDAAKLFAHFITSAEWQKKNFEMTGNLPADKTLAEDEVIKNDPIASGFLKQFENSVPMPSIPEMVQYWNTIDATLAAMWNDGIDPQKALDDMVSKMKQNMAK
ncbi:maltose ABC transporter substrate-binding protein [Paenibacillus sambharensis]|uniref:Maltose ABC transporter substrate-binding protein n=1 Tax=Paenibacillus sambharensis TaxID=1803190 RepID=A0A2W1LCV6_9BACL|nr:maltose ABC transporter substrate-binding protein [Paenibacillus sambharensis]PZD95890.1 maltose ABC transporter substrate-binding protein [Paenibacillus sambharensis]